MRGGYSDKGSVRPVNQDACCFLAADSSCGPVAMALMCDGVGGMSSGELASATVVQKFALWFDRDLPSLSSGCASEGILVREVRSAWKRLLDDVNAELFERSGQARGPNRLGTTFTGAFIVAHLLLVAQVGDCRAYRITPQEAVQITKDQTLLARALEEGLIDRSNSAGLPKKNIILQAVGSHSQIKPEFTLEPYDPSSIYLLCCDGFYGRVTPNEMAERFARCAALNDAALEAACTDLAQLALGRGESDNISAIALCGQPDDQMALGTLEAARNLDAILPSFDPDDASAVAFDPDEMPTVSLEASASGSFGVTKRLVIMHGEPLAPERGGD